MAAPAIVNKSCFYSGDYTNPPLTTAPFTAGNLVLAAVRWRGSAGSPAPPTVSDGTNVYTSLYNDGAAKGAWDSSPVNPAGSNTITFFSNLGLFAFEASSLYLEIANYDGGVTYSIFSGTGTVIHAENGPFSLDLNTKDSAVSVWVTVTAVVTSGTGEKLAIAIVFADGNFDGPPFPLLWTEQFDASQNGGTGNHDLLSGPLNAFTATSTPVIANPNQIQVFVVTS